MVLVLITPTSAVLPFKILIMGRAILRIRSAEMVTVVMAVTTTAFQLSKNFNVVEPTQVDSDSSVTEVLDHVVVKLHTIQTNTIVVRVDSCKLLEHALILKILKTLVLSTTTAQIFHIRASIIISITER